MRKSLKDYTVIEAFCEVMLAANKILYLVQYHREAVAYVGIRNISTHTGTCDSAEVVFLVFFFLR